ncbi:MAG: hypothetical protein V2A76_02110 [Planctomycetota bacterium]
MNHQQVEELKRMVVHDRELKPVMEYFFVHFAGDPEIYTGGVPWRDPVLATVFESAARQILGSAVELCGLTLTHLPEHRLVHGSMSLGGAWAAAIFFDDVKTGVMAMITDLEQAEVRHIRISYGVLPATCDPGLN